MMGEQEFTADERIAIFKSATHTFAHWYGKRFKEPMTDDQLGEFLKSGLGISGGSGPGHVCSFSCNGPSGLKIWASRSMAGVVERGKPLFQGKQTIAMARKVYGIKNPAIAAQMSLF